MNIAYLETKLDNVHLQQDSNLHQTEESGY